MDSKWSTFIILVIIIIFGVIAIYWLIVSIEFDGANPTNGFSNNDNVKIHSLVADAPPLTLESNCQFCTTNSTGNPGYLDGNCVATFNNSSTTGFNKWELSVQSINTVENMNDSVTYGNGNRYYLTSFGSWPDNCSQGNGKIRGAILLTNDTPAEDSIKYVVGQSTFETYQGLITDINWAPYFEPAAVGDQSYIGLYYMKFPSDGTAKTAADEIGRVRPSPAGTNDSEYQTANYQQPGIAIYDIKGVGTGNSIMEYLFFVEQVQQ